MFHSCHNLTYLKQSKIRRKDVLFKRKTNQKKNVNGVLIWPYPKGRRTANVLETSLYLFPKLRTGNVVLRLFKKSEKERKVVQTQVSVKLAVFDQTVNPYTVASLVARVELSFFAFPLNSTCQGRFLRWRLHQLVYS